MKKYFLFITILLLSIIFFNSYLTSRKFIEGNTTLSDEKIKKIDTIIGELIEDGTFLNKIIKIWIGEKNIDIYFIKQIAKEYMHIIKKILENMNNQDFISTQMSKIQNLRNDMQNIEKFIAGELSQINPSTEILNFVDYILTTIKREKISTILSITGDITNKVPFQAFLSKMKESLQEFNSNDFTEFKNKLQEKLKNISADELKAYFESDDNTYAYIKTNMSFM